MMKFHVALARVRKIADAARGFNVTVKPSDMLPMEYNMSQGKFRQAAANLKRQQERDEKRRGKEKKKHTAVGGY